jgi:hypothetical protein
MNGTERKGTERNGKERKGTERKGKEIMVSTNSHESRV